MADTRKDRRAPVSLKVRFKSATVDEFIEQYSKDVSRGGIFIKSSQPMAVGTLLKFQFQLKDESALIRGVGRVVWTRAEEDAGAEKPSGMGIKFIKMDADSKSMVERILDAHGEARGAFESGRESATTAEPYSDRPPASNGGGGSFFPETTPMNELPAPEDRTAVRHAAQFLASALSEAGTDEAATREAEQKADEARRRTQQIEAQRAVDAERRKKAASGGAEALPSMIIDPSLSGGAEDEHTEPVPKVPESQIPTMAGLKPVELPAQPPANRTSKSPSKPPPKAAPAKTPSQPPAPVKSEKPAAPKAASKASSKPVSKPAPKPEASPEDDTSITDRKKVVPSEPPPAEVPAKKLSGLVVAIVITAAIVIAAFLALRGGEDPVPVVEEQIEAAPPEPAPQPEPPEQAAPVQPSEPARVPDAAAAAAPEPAPVEAVQIPPAPDAPAPGATPERASERPATDNRLGRVRVISSPMGASVFINDKPHGKTPLMIDLARGRTHTITARQAGYVEASQLVTPSGNLSAVKLELTPLTFVLHIDTVPSGASVSAGGKRGTSPTDITLVAPPKGPMIVGATLPGYASTVGKVGPSDFKQDGNAMRATITLNLEEPGERPSEPTPAPAPAPAPEPKTEAAPKPAPAPAPKPAPAPAPAPAPTPAPPPADVPDNPFAQ